MSDLDKLARAICREKCAFYGEPPCWNFADEWPNTGCDEPGCHALAAAGLAALAAHDAAILRAVKAKGA